MELVKVKNTTEIKKGDTVVITGKELESNRLFEIVEELRRMRTKHKQGSPEWFEYISVTDKLASLASHIQNGI